MVVQGFPWEACPMVVTTMGSNDMGSNDMEHFGLLIRMSVSGYRG